jgi:transposase
MARVIASRPAAASGTANPIPLPTLPDRPDIPHQTPTIRYTFSPSRRYSFSPPFTAIWLLAQGRTFFEVGEVLAFAPRWVEELAARYNAHGPEALGDQRRRNGRAASLLTKDVLAALTERVRTPPDDGGLWSGPKVAAWMARRLGLERVHPQRGWEALKRIDWSLQAPRPRHPRAATPEQRAAFKGGSMPLSLRPKRRIPTGRLRFGRRMSTALA